MLVPAPSADQKPEDSWYELRLSLAIKPSFYFEKENRISFESFVSAFDFYRWQILGSWRIVAQNYEFPAKKSSCRHYFITKLANIIPSNGKGKLRSLKPRRRKNEEEKMSLERFGFRDRPRQLRWIQNVIILYERQTENINTVKFRRPPPPRKNSP